MINPDHTVEQVSDLLLSYMSRELGRILEYESPLTQISGGNEAYLYRFQLHGSGDEMYQPLVLRLFPRFYPPGRASWDSLVQNVLTDSGYPAPRVYLTCTDEAVLGGSFMVMRLIDGEPLSNYEPLEAATLLGRAQAELHCLDTPTIKLALMKAGVVESRYRLGGLLDWLYGRISERYSGWLGGCAKWMRDNKPEEPGSLSAVHGDFHPLNVLVRDGEVVGVLDWPNFRLADPAMDIAFTLVLAEGALKYAMNVENVGDFTAAYLSAYRRILPIDDERIPYYKVLRCVMALQEGADGQVVWTHPEIIGYLTDEIHAQSGVSVEPPSTGR